MDVNTLETTLKNQQWVGGATPTVADKDAFDQIKGGNLYAETHPHVFAWFCLVYKFSDAVKDTWPAAGAAAAGGGKQGKGKQEKQEGGKGKKGGKKEAAPAKTEEDLEIDDLFGDDADDGEAAKEAAAKVAAAAAGKKKEKKKVIEKSLVILDVKPYDDKTDLDKLAARILKNVTKDGLMWKTEYKIVPVAFGICKLNIGMTIIDEKISVDNDVVEKIEEMDDMVQSVDILVFDKL